MADRPESSRGGAARHGAASRVAGATAEKKTPWAVIGIAGVVLVGVIAFLFNDPNKEERNFGKAIESADGRSNSSARGQRGAFTLPDSTNVKIGPESSIRIPPNYNTQVRGVGVVGAAQITTRPGTGEKPLPFRVRTRNVGIMSTGGVFMVSAYPEGKEVFVKAVENGLTIHPKADDKAEQQLAVGAGIAISDSGTVRPLSQPESDGAFAWAGGNLNIAAMPLEQTIPLILQRWYNTNAALGDKALGSRPVTATMSLEGSKGALDAINASAGTHIEFRHDTLTLVDGAVAAKPAAPAKKKGK
ncbi:MAG: FecR domain-containing protein [Gemmatimonadaceae bacterium]